MRNLRAFLIRGLIALSLLAGFHASAIVQTVDGDGNLETVSMDSYLGIQRKPWRTDDSLTSSQKLYWEFLFNSSYFLSDRLRWPNGEEAAVILEKSKKAVLKSTYETIDGERIETPPDEIDWDVDDVLAGHPDPMQDFRENFSEMYIYLRRQLASLFIRAVRQGDQLFPTRIVPTTPDEELYFLAAVKSKVTSGPKVLIDHLKGKFTIEHLRDLYTPGRESARSGHFPQPLIFKSYFALEEAALFDFNSAFTNYVPSSKVNVERAARTLEALENAKGFIITTWTAGQGKVPKDYLEALLAMLEEKKDWILLVGPAMQQYLMLPDIFWTHPRIHVVTHTIENRYLKITNLPLNPYMEDEIPTLAKAGYEHGQIVVGFHPHQRLETVATTTNAEAPTYLLTTGAINEGLPRNTTPNMGKNRIATEDFYELGAYIFEKGDGISEFDADGMHNIWHFRGIEFYNDVKHNGTAGFIDLGTAYQFNYSSGERIFEKKHVAPLNIYVGDPHWPEANPRYEHAFLHEQDLDRDAFFYLIGGDTFDMGNGSHWILKQVLTLRKRAKQDSLNIEKAVNSVIDVINAFQAWFPNAKYAQIVGNHDEWLPMLMQKRAEIHDVINGDFLDELNFAVGTLGIPLWEYIFHEREQIWTALLAHNPGKRDEILKRLKPVYDRNRIEVIERGDPFYFGPSWRRASDGNHGDKTTFGKKNSTLKDQAKGAPKGGSSTGHRHILGKYKKSKDPGAMLLPEGSDYARGFFSSVGQGFIRRYENGISQLIPFNSQAGNFRQTAPSQVLPPKKFYGGQPLQIHQNPNEEYDQTEGREYAYRELAKMAEEIGCVSALVKP